MECMTPAMIGTMRLKNRFIFPSMCNFYCDAEGFVTEQLKAYVRARAEGGADAFFENLDALTYSALLAEKSLLQMRSAQRREIPRCCCRTTRPGR